MTKINIYCLFDETDTFHGVYSSLKAVHRDALRLCNKGTSQVYVDGSDGPRAVSLTLLRNTFKGELDVKVVYRAGRHAATIVKTKLRE